MQKIVIFGASNQSDSVLDCIQKENKYEVIGFVDSVKKKGQLYKGIEVFGADHELQTICVKYQIYGGIVGAKNNYRRKCIVDKVLSILPQFNFVTTVNPTAIVETNVMLGNGVAVMAGAVVKSHCKIENYCIVGSNSVVEKHGHMHVFSSLDEGVYCGDNFNLGIFSAICMGTTIVKNINIGNHVVAFAGSFIMEDVENNVLAHFTPNKEIEKKEIPPIKKSRRRRSTSFLF